MLEQVEIGTEETRYWMDFSRKLGRQMIYLLTDLYSNDVERS
jgi:hypothetical protein